MKLSLVTVLALVPFNVPAAAQQEWVWYRDAANRCEVQYDHGMFGKNSLDSEGSRVFSGATEGITFRVKGLRNDENMTPRELRNEYLVRRASGGLTYQIAKDDFLVVSGVKEGKIFYTRVAVSPDNTRICVLDISYPGKFKRQLDSTVTRMSRSFRGY